MTNTFGRPSRPAATTPLPMSALALSSFICALIACCPFTSLAAIVLGVAGMRVTAGTAPRRRGRRLAVAGTAIGAAALVVQFGLQNWFASIYMPRLDASMERAVQVAIERASQGDHAGVVGVWAGVGATPDAPSIDRFGDAVRDRLGGYKGMSIVNRTPGGTLMQPSMKVAATFSFERGDCTGAATFMLVPRVDNIFPTARLSELVIEDASLGTLRLP
ncbi:MAG: DUF4190 domain-containing protein [Phycisphaerales bacterium]|nr:DUF4190 domain-containing protein [Phycisphaerales bacterium]